MRTRYTQKKLEITNRITQPLYITFQAMRTFYPLHQWSQTQMETDICGQNIDLEKPQIYIVVIFLFILLDIPQLHFNLVLAPLCQLPEEHI